MLRGIVKEEYLLAKEVGTGSPNMQKIQDMARPLVAR
jgi:hypothetical protein